MICRLFQCFSARRQKAHSTVVTLARNLGASRIIQYGTDDAQCLSTSTHTWQHTQPYRIEHAPHVIDTAAEQAERNTSAWGVGRGGGGVGRRKMALWWIYSRQLTDPNRPSGSIFLFRRSFCVQDPSEG